MPRVQPETWHLCLLLFCVPFQYFLVQYWGSNEASRIHVINQFLKSFVKFKETYLRWSTWQSWCLRLLSNIWKLNSSPTDVYEINLDDHQGESPAVEVLKYKQEQGYFATSPQSRNPRSPVVKYRIGQVVVHKSWKYRGVIIGWDEEAKAPEYWLKEMYGSSHNEWRKMPNYAVLVDVRDRSSPQMTYVPEENIIPVKSTRILHPHLEDYFEKFDGAQYIPRPWLQSLYPHD